MKKKYFNKLTAIAMAALMGMSFPMTVGAEEGAAGGEGETLVLAYPKDLGPMNPHTMKSPMYAQDWVYDGLTQLVNGEVKPELAESWEISEDGKEYTFHLRQGVKFSDGTDLTAEIVKKNLDAVIAHKDGFTFLQSLEEINEVIVQDESTIVLKLNNPCNSLLSDFTFTRPITIAAEAAFPESGDIYTDGPAAVIGSGMWVLKEYVENQYALFERNEYYWGETPYYQYVKVLVIPDTDTVVNSLKAGEIDMYIDVNDGLSIDAFEELKNSGFTADVAPNTQVTSLSVNTAGEITGDVLVRRGLEYATDNTVISEYVFGGYQLPATSYFADGIAYTDVDLEPYTYDPEQAAALFDEAGWVLEDGAQYRTKDGKDLEVDMLYDTVNSNGKNIGLVLQDQYAQVGVKLNICEEDSQVFRQKWAEGDFGMILYSSWGGSYEPFATLAAMRTEGDKFNTVQAGLENKTELDEIMNSALSEVDTAKLQEDFDYILGTFHDQAVYIPLTVASTFAVYRSDLTGLDLSESKDTMYVGSVKPAE